MTTLELVHGVIDRVNAKGFRLQGEADWRNYSRYADPADILPPTIGAAVAVSIDSQGFVRSVQILTNEYVPTSQSESLNQLPTDNHRPDKDTTITRLACLRCSGDGRCVAGRSRRYDDDGHCRGVRGMGKEMTREQGWGPNRAPIHARDITIRQSGLLDAGARLAALPRR